MVRGSRSCDVVVIGGGLSGLRAARDLAARGVDVLVLEAQERVGGRTLTVSHTDGGFIDHGGQYVSPGQDRLVALADEIGVKLFPSWSGGRTVRWSGGARSTFDGLLPPDDPEAEPAAREAAATLTRMAESVPLDAPWAAPDAAAWDADTLHGWLADNIASLDARTALSQAIEGVFAGGAGRTSLLAALFWIRSGDPLVPFVSTADPGPERRFDGGAQQLSSRMAAGLGDRVVLGATVSRIDHRASDVNVTAGDLAVSARRAIIAVPPALAGRIRYVPALPAVRDQLTQRTPMRWLIKVHCVYPSRFWAYDGLSGLAKGDAGLVRLCADNSPPSGSPGILVGFIGEGEAPRAATMTAGQRRTEVLADLVRYFGDLAGQPLGYHEMVWGDDEFTRGAEGGYWTPGVWTSYGPALQASVGVLHWAGTETSPVWNGKMEGAVRSGERAAVEVLTAMS
jgi:monoamine oxidase